LGCSLESPLRPLGEIGRCQSALNTCHTAVHGSRRLHPA
jgi:hypothetical protein